MPELEGPRTLFDPREPADSLEDLVERAWEALRTGRPTSCPLCGERLVPRYGAGATPVGARCSACASELA